MNYYYCYWNQKSGPNYCSKINELPLRWRRGYTVKRIYVRDSKDLSKFLGIKWL